MSEWCANFQFKKSELRFALRSGNAVHSGEAKYDILQLRQYNAVRTAKQILFILFEQYCFFNIWY